MLRIRWCQDWGKYLEQCVYLFRLPRLIQINPFLLMKNRGATEPTEGRLPFVFILLPANVIFAIVFQILMFDLLSFFKYIILILFRKRKFIACFTRV